MRLQPRPPLPFAGLGWDALAVDAAVAAAGGADAAVGERSHFELGGDASRRQQQPRPMPDDEHDEVVVAGAAVGGVANYQPGSGAYCVWSEWPPGPPTIGGIEGGGNHRDSDQT